MRVDIIETTGALAGLRADWDALVRSCRKAG